MIIVDLLSDVGDFLLGADSAQLQGFDVYLLGADSAYLVGADGAYLLGD